MTVLQWINDITINFIAFESGVQTIYWNDELSYIQRRQSISFKIHWTWLQLRVVHTQSIYLHLWNWMFMIWYPFYQFVSKYVALLLLLNRPFKWYYCKLINFIQSAWTSVCLESLDMISFPLKFNYDAPMAKCHYNALRV